MVYSGNRISCRERELLELGGGYMGLNWLYLLCANEWGFPGGSVVKNLPAMQEMRA